MKFIDFQGTETRGDSAAMTNKSWIGRDTATVSTKITFSRNINFMEADV